MQRIVFTLVAFLTMTLAVSCGSDGSKAAVKLDSFVDGVEAKSGELSEKDWEEINAEFDELVEKVSENYDKMTDEERARAMKAIGRYSGIYAKKGVEAAKDGLQKAMEALTPFIEGFSSAFDGDEEK